MKKESNMENSLLDMDNDLFLAKTVMEWRNTHDQLEYLERLIEREIVQRQESYVIPGVVKATYYKPGLDYNYEAGVLGSGRPRGVIKGAIKDNSTKVREYVSWANVAEALEIDKDDIPADERPARVTIKAE